MDLPDFSKDEKFIALRKAMGIKPKMKYTPQLYPVRDKVGNRYYAGVQLDEIDGTYVGSIKNYKGVIIGLGEADTPHDAAANAALNLDSRREAIAEQISERGEA